MTHSDCEKILSETITGKLQVKNVSNAYYNHIELSFVWVLGWRLRERLQLSYPLTPSGKYAQNCCKSKIFL